MMDDPTFWSLIETSGQASQGSAAEQVRQLTDALARLPEEQIIGFHARFRDYLGLAYTEELWAAAYILNGGCSDDCFDYFRAWLIAQGERVFQDALRDPETLADHAEVEEVELEAMLYATLVAYERKTGQRMPRQPRPPLQLRGEPWDEATVAKKYPRLAAMWG